VTLDNAEFIVRCSRLRDERKSLRFLSTDIDTPIMADWVAISHSVVKSNDPRVPRDNFNVYFMTDDGKCSAMASFDTIDVAMDRVSIVAGVEGHEWRPCRVEITSDDISVRWSDVA
jgi:hypothetical protein